MKKRYKILSIILALVIALGSIVAISVVSSSAESFTDENGISWTVAENKPGWAIKPTDKSAISGSVVIPSEYNGQPINMISSQGFEGCSDLTEITIPDSVRKIAGYAFNGCTNLTTINFGTGLETIVGDSFSNCTSLESIVIPDGVTLFGGLKNCTNLKSITFPDRVETIGPIKNCVNLTSIEIPDGVTKIGSFSGCTGLTSISIPNSVTAIGSFEGCTNLISITLPDGLTTLGEKTFKNCTSLTEINLPDSITGTIYKTAFETTAWYNNQPDGVIYLGHICLGYKGTKPTGTLVIKEGTKELAQSAFLACTGITSVSLPSTLRNISYRAFYGCSNLTSITVPDSVTTIETEAFRECTKLSSVNLGSGLQTIKPSVFYGCTSLESVVIPDNVKTIGNSAFYGCTQLADVSMSANTTMGTDVFKNTAWYNNQPDGLIYNNDVLIGYKGTKPTGTLEIKDGTVAIGGGALSGCTGITSVVIPSSVTNISQSAFFGCSSLTSITIPEGVVTIGDYAFSNCSSLESVTLSDSVKTIGYKSFAPDSTIVTSNLKTIDFGKGIEYIGDYAFTKCVQLTTVTIPGNVKEIGRMAFSYCTNLETVNILDGVEIIGHSAFFNNRNLKTVNFGNGLRIIDDFAFSLCKSLEAAIIPDGTTNINAGAFNECISINTISLPSSITKTELDAFCDCGFIENLVLGCSYDVLDASTFLNDTFKNVTLGENVTSIEDEFSNMDTLESIVIPDTVTNIKDTAFTGSNNVTITTPANSTAHKFAVSNNIPVKTIDRLITDTPVSFEVTCDKTGYEFTVYRVADLNKYENPYGASYDSLIDEIKDEIFEGDSVALLEELDKVDSSLLTEVVGTYNTDVDGSSKLFEDLPAGIYYVRATNFPANVYSVQNSVFALPYYDAQEGWQYFIEPIPLATKVDESNPEIVKAITNSTKDNVNFTDVSLGDTVNFEIEASRVGSANVVESKDFRLNSYVVSDIMENGLTLNQDSFVVTLEDADGNTLTTLEDTTDYVVDIVANDGADTTFTVSLTPEYLQEDEFYSSANVVIAYSAVLNKYSTREFDGNYNTATNLTYSNKTNVSATVEGNTVYAYTFGIEVNKYDDAGTPLAGSQFGLYLTEDDAKAMANAIATGTSTDTGKVEFFTESNDVIRLASGTYYIVETKATESYNRYTDVIPVTITVNYGDTEVNGTYIESAPENGIQLVEVKNSKVVIPNTGGDGAMYRYIIALAFAMLAVTLIVVKKRSSKKATATK